MDCLHVRGRLAEFALGTLGPDERVLVERHLEWCAGCRKEAWELARGAAAAGLSLEPADPPAELEERLVEAVATAAGRRVPRRRRLAAVAGVAAAMTAVAGLGYGTFMAGRAQQLEAAKQEAEEKAEIAVRQAEDIAARLEAVLEGLQVLDEAVLRAQLAPTPGFRGGGAAVVLDSTNQHWALVVVGGLPDDGLPYRVSLVTRAGRVLEVGKIRKLDAGGGEEVFRDFTVSLKDVSRIVVRSAAGDIVLSGRVPPATAVAP